MDFAQARRNMVDCQLRTFDVTDRAVLAAMAAVPRERFVPAGRESLAYVDRTVAAADGPSDGPFLLAPMLLARLIQALAIRSGDKVLDVGSGRGYAAEIMTQLGAQVVRLDSDLAAGAPDEAPFDAILINGAVEVRPDALLAQLAEGGRLACVASDDGRVGRAVLHLRSGDSFSFRTLFDAQAPTLPGFRKPPAFIF